MKQWEATDSNYNDIDESQVHWDLVKHNLEHLRFNNNDQIINLPNEMEYVQGKTASATLGSSGITIESRFIGFRLGNNIVKVRVNEETNNISIEVEHDPNHIPSSGQPETTD